MNKQRIIETIKNLSKSQGFYNNLYQWILEDSEETNNYLDQLVKKNFKDEIDLIMYFEE